MGAILLAVTGLDPKPWEERFRAIAPRRDIRVWPERVGEPGEVAYACAWHAPHGLLAHFLHLKIVFSLGAGVDHIVVIRICRMCRSCAWSMPTSTFG